MELDDILKKVWRNGYEINRWGELKTELRAYYGEQIAREIEARVIGSVDTKGGFGEAFNQGIVTAAAIAKGE